jgi:hypothetical protein
MGGHDRRTSPGLYWWRDGGVSLLPSQVEANNVQFAPPDEFVQVLNGLSPKRA